MAIVVGTLGWEGIQSVSLAWRLNLRQSCKKKTPKHCEKWPFVLFLWELRLCKNLYVLTWYLIGYAKDCGTIISLPHGKGWRIVLLRFSLSFCLRRFQCSLWNSYKWLIVNSKCLEEKKKSPSYFLINKAGICLYWWKIFCLLPC